MSPIGLGPKIIRHTVNRKSKKQIVARIIFSHKNHTTVPLDKPILVSSLELRIALYLSALITETIKKVKLRINITSL